MFFLYVCVVVCEVLYDFPIIKEHLPETIHYEGIGYINPFLWYRDFCLFCNNEWQISYVHNASQYTTFLLFTRDSGMNYTLVEINNTQVLYNGGFNSSKDTKVLIHGWLDNGTNRFALNVREAFLLGEDVNVIAVSWEPMALTLYPLARSAVVPIGSYTAQLIDFLITDPEVSITADSLQLIGHSLGAQIAGVVGEHVTFGNLSRITGLDPAGPLFGTDLTGRLDSSDAVFVDVIHTTWEYLGYSAPCGDADFYPNGGSPIQPGCGVDVGTCSHKRAYQYFSESITSIGFISTACSSWYDYKSGSCTNNSRSIMGEHVNLRAKGNYYLRTNPTSPYAAWNKSLQEESQNQEFHFKDHMLLIYWIKEVLFGFLFHHE